MAMQRAPRRTRDSAAKLLEFVKDSRVETQLEIALMMAKGKPAWIKHFTLDGSYTLSPEDLSEAVSAIAQSLGLNGPGSAAVASAPTQDLSPDAFGEESTPYVGAKPVAPPAALVPEPAPTPTPAPAVVAAAEPA